MTVATPLDESGGDGANLERILIVVPAFNEEASIAAVIDDLKLRAARFDRVVINDGSTDRTGQIVRAAGERMLDVPVNLGYGKALQLGFRYMLARGYDAVLFFDGDGQHCAAEVPQLIAALEPDGVDLVIGSRFVASRSYEGSRVRRFAQRWFSWLTRPLLGRRVYDTTSGLKGFSARACERLVVAPFLDFHVEAIIRLRMLRYGIVEIPVEVRKRRAGKSMYSWVTALKYPLKTTALTLVAVIDGLLSRRREPQ